MKYKYSRKEIAVDLHNLLKFGEKVDYPTLWSEINQIKLNLLTISATKPEKECKHERVTTTPNGWEMWVCPDCHSVVEFKPEKEIKPIEKMVLEVYGDDPVLYGLHKKQCEIIDAVNNLKQK